MIKKQGWEFALKTKTNSSLGLDCVENVQEKSPITAFSGYNLVIVHLLVNLGWVGLGGGGGDLE